jgi:hypothetical protein
MLAMPVNPSLDALLLHPLKIPSTILLKMRISIYNRMIDARPLCF